MEWNSTFYTKVCPLCNKWVEMDKSCKCAHYMTPEALGKRDARAKNSPKISKRVNIFGRMIQKYVKLAERTAKRKRMKLCSK